MIFGASDIKNMLTIKYINCTQNRSFSNESYDVQRIYENYSMRKTRDELAEL